MASFAHLKLGRRDQLRRRGEAREKMKAKEQKRKEKLIQQGKAKTSGQTTLRLWLGGGKMKKPKSEAKVGWDREGVG